MIQRPYHSGDEDAINVLYKRITGRVRSHHEFMWEWVHTWNGQGSMWLIFDSENNVEGQLIAQYSLIPTPMSFFGKTYLTGKTENCMSHPDIRGTKIYFPHEEKYFKLAQKRFKAFFTTTGDVAKGAPGRIREKLGYRAFDDWATYRLPVHGQISSESLMKLFPFPTLIKKNKILNKITVIFFNLILKSTSKPRNISIKTKIQIKSDKDINFSQVEKLWKKNINLYGITIERTERYLNWRFKENPYHKHTYICCYKDEKLLGYAVIVIELNTCLIIDIFADQKDKKIFASILMAIKKYAFQEKINQIKCNTNKRNSYLGEILKSAGFYNIEAFFDRVCLKEPGKAKQIFVYISDEIEQKKNPWDNKEWFITDIMKEGRPYTVERFGLDQ